MNLRQAAQQALKEMDDHMYRADTHEFYEAKEALRAALAEPEQEPVAWAVYDILHGGSKTLHWPEQHSPNGDPKQYKAVPLYTAPTPRKPLRDEEIDPLLDAVPRYYIKDSDLIDFARAIERAHGIGEQT